MKLNYFDLFGSWLRALHSSHVDVFLGAGHTRHLPDLDRSVLCTVIIEGSVSVASNLLPHLLAVLHLEALTKILPLAAIAFGLVGALDQHLDEVRVGGSFDT